MIVIFRPDLTNGDDDACVFIYESWMSAPQFFIESWPTCWLTSFKQAFTTSPWRGWSQWRWIWPDPNNFDPGIFGMGFCRNILMMKKNILMVKSMKMNMTHFRSHLKTHSGEKSNKCGQASNRLLPQARDEDDINEDDYDWWWLSNSKNITSSPLSCSFY